jgi:hypothetical protein
MEGDDDVFWMPNILNKTLAEIKKPRSSAN